MASVWTVGLWLWLSFSFWLGMAAFGIDLEVLAAMFTQAVVAFVVAAPSAPGFVGTFHWAASWALEAGYAVDAARAVAFATAYHLGGWIPITLIGLGYTWKLGLSLGDVGRSGSQVGPHPPARTAPATEPGPEPLVNEVHIRAPAKVNLLLRVLGPRPDGRYHEIETVLQAIGMEDEIAIREGREERVVLTVVGAELGPAEDNLVTRAAKLFAAELGVPPRFEIRLVKKIPSGAGLGGGSSDAGATLRALNLMFGSPFGDEILHRLAARLGSDVPFFIGPSTTAVAWGRGELTRPIDPLPVRPFLVGLPDVHVATGDAYRALAAARDGGALTASRPDARSIQAIERLDWDQVAEWGRNDFEEVVPSLHDEIARTMSAFRASDASMVLLSGSGSAVFGLFDDEADAVRAREQLVADGFRCRVTHTLAGFPQPRPAG